MSKRIARRNLSVRSISPAIGKATQVLSLAAGAVALGLGSGSAHAAGVAYTFVGATNTNWTDTTAGDGVMVWNPDATPGAGDYATVQVAGGDRKINLTAPASVDYLTLGTPSGSPFTTDIGNGGVTNALTFDNTGGTGTNNADGSTNAAITSGGVAGAINVISAPVILNGLTAASGTTNFTSASTNPISITGTITGTAGATAVTRTILTATQGAGNGITLGNLTTASVGAPAAAITNILQFSTLNNSTTAVWAPMNLTGVISNGAQANGFNVNTQVVFGTAGANVANTIQTITVSGANTFSGGARLFRVELVLGSDTALGTGGFQHGSGAAATTMGYDIASTDDARTISNGFTMQRNVTFNGSHSLTWKGNITQSNASQLTNNIIAGKTLFLGTNNGTTDTGIVFFDNSTNGKSFTFDGSGSTESDGDLQDTSTGSASSNLSKVGDGSLYLNGVATAGSPGQSSYHGVTNVTGGFVRMGALWGTGNTSAITVSSGGGFGVDPGTTAAAVLTKLDAGGTSRGALDLSGGTGSTDLTSNLDFTGTVGGAVNLSASQTVNMSVGGLGNVTYTGTITPAASTYRLGGIGGTITLSNTNALTGGNALAVVNGGGTSLTSTNNYSGATSLQGTYLGLGTNNNNEQTAAANNGTLVPTGVYVAPTLTVTNIADGSSSLGSSATPIAINGGTLAFNAATNQVSSRGITVGPTGATVDSSGASPVTLNGASGGTDTGPVLGSVSAAASNTISSVTDTTNLAVGMTVSGTNIPANTTIIGLTPNTIRLSQNSTAGTVATGTGLSFTGQNRTLTLTGSNTGNNTIGGAVSNSAQGTLGVSKTGSGTWVLSGANTFSGPVTISNGTLKLGGTGSAGAAANVTTVSGGTTAGTLDLNGTNVVYGKDIVLGTTGGATTASLTNSSASPATLSNGSSYTVTGSGFTSLPTVSVSNGGGTGGAVAVNSAVVGGMSLTAAGSGFSTPPTVSFGGGGGTGAAASTTLKLLGSNLVPGTSLSGSSYASPPTVTLSGGGGFGASATSLLGISNGTVAVEAGGTGYDVNPPTVTFAPPTTGTAATGHAVVSGGVIQSIVVDTPGSGYTTPPGITITGGNNDASADFGGNVNIFGVTGVNVTANGVGYTSLPTFAFGAGGGGSGATATATMGVGSLLFTNNGTGYTSAPTVTISGDGAGATGSATLTLSESGVTVTPGSGYTSAPSATLNTAGTGGTGAVTADYGHVVLNATANAGGTGDITINGIVSGAGGLTKIGGDTVLLTTAEAYAGNTTVSAGTLAIGPTANLNSGNNLTVNAGSATYQPVNAAAGIVASTLGNVSVTGGAVTLQTATAHSDRRVLVANSVSVTGSGAVDLGGNDMIVHNGNMSNLTSWARTGLVGGGGGIWTGPGLRTAVGAADTRGITAIGLQQVTASGMFDGQPVVTTDVVAKETFFGDATMDGTVNAADYSATDNGYAMHLTGWVNGDFNYDGTTNAADYSLIDQAYVFQTAAGGPVAPLAAALAAVDGGGSSVPEPASVGLLAVAAGGLLARRRRTSR
jgi:autotransporter-associated beta strand protein